MRIHSRIDRDRRRADAALRRDLSTFTTAAELLELSSVLRRHDDRAVETVRDIVDWRAVA